MYPGVGRRTLVEFRITGIFCNIGHVPRWNRKYISRGNLIIGPHGNRQGNP